MYLCTAFHQKGMLEAQMAESVDALVSNTSGATRAGSTPALGTSVPECKYWPQNSTRCCNSKDCSTFFKQRRIVTPDEEAQRQVGQPDTGSARGRFGGHLYQECGQ